MTEQERWDMANTIYTNIVHRDDSDSWRENVMDYIRQAEESAWDAGREAEADAQFQDAGYGNVQHPTNPYRREE